MAAVGTVLQVFPHFNPGVGGIGKRVFGDRVQITCGDQICKVLWRYFLVLGVLVDGGAHVVKIFFEECFARAFAVGASCHEEQREYYDRVAQPWKALQLLYLQSELRTQVWRRLATTF